MEIKKPNNLIVTNGDKDIIHYYENTKSIYKINKVNDIVNVTGAGDALLSGIVYSLNQSLSFDKAIENGMKLASLTLKSSSSVAKDLRKELLYESTNYR